MPTPTVLIGPPGPVTDEPFFSRVVAWCTDIRRAPRLRYLVPTARRRMDVENAILGACPRGRALCQAPVETLDRFTQNLFRASERGRMISWRTAALVIETLLAEAPADFESLLSGRSTPFPGLVQRALAAIRELKRFAVEPATLAGAAGPHDAKAKELALLFQRYEAFLHAQQWYDERAPYLVLAERLADRPFRTDTLANIDWVVLDGFVEFSPSELPIVQALAEAVETTFVFDSDPSLPELFPMVPDWGTPPGTRTSASPFRDVARCAVSARETPHVPATVDVRVIEAASRAEEVDRIASAIKGLLLDGTAQRDIAVAVPNLEHYAELVEDIFSAHGVPCSIARRPSLIEGPVTAAVLRLLEVPARDFERADVVRLFQSPFVRFECDGHVLDPSALEHLARVSRVFRTRESWLEGLRRRIAALEELSAKAEGQRIDEAETGAATSPDEELQRLTPLRATLEPAFDALTALREPRPVSEYAASLRAVMVRFRLERQAAQSMAVEPTAGVHAQSVADVFGVLDELAVLDQASPKPHAVSLEQFTELFRSSVAATPLGCRAPLEGVEVLDMKNASERQSRTLFCAGLVEGAVPAAVAHDVLLGPELRQRIGLPSADRLAADKRIELYRTIASASEQLVLTRPTVENEKPLLRPMMLERILAATGRTPRQEEARPPTCWRAVLRALGHDALTLAPVEKLVENDAFARHAPLHAFAHARAVERARRAAPTTPTPYAGALSQGLLNEVRRVYDRDHEFSAGELELYVRCPFRFFARWLLDLRPTEELEEAMTPRDKGNVFHAIFRDFYGEWRRRRGTGRIENNDRDEALDLLRSIAHDHLAKQPYGGFLWRKFVDRLFGGRSPAGDELFGLFDRFIELEISSGASTTACTPTYLELGFGHQRHAGVLDPRSDETPIPITAAGRRIFLRGIIDRVDTNADEGTFCVLDYKSGSTIPSVKDILSGLSPQLPIYIMAAQGILGEAYRFAAAGYVQAKDAAHCGKKHFLGDDALARQAVARRWSSTSTMSGNELRAWLAREREHVGASVVGIESGRFNVTQRGPRHARCSACDYIHLCRYDGLTVQTFEERR